MSLRGAGNFKPMIENTQVMLDIETLGQRPGSIIVAIGAVKFDARNCIDQFYERIDPQSARSCGLTMDVPTVLWWMEQSDAARKELTAGGLPLDLVLGRFAHWIGEPAKVEMWGNGSNFDNVLLRAAYEYLGKEAPWRWWNDRCYRTLKTMFREVPYQATGTKHNALDDARSQALHLMEILKRMREGESAQ